MKIFVIEFNTKQKCNLEEWFCVIKISPPQNDTFKYLDEQKLNFNPERQLFQTRYYTGVTNVLE